MSGQTVLTQLHEGVLEVTLNRPERLNAVTPRLMTELLAACREARRPEVRAVLLTGAGRAFCAGADLKELPEVQPPSRRFRQQYHPTILELASLPKPVVVAVNGPVVGAGLALMSVGDVRMASADAIFRAGFIDVGQATDNGASFFVSRALGYADAFTFLLTSESWDAARARACGLVDRVDPPDELMAAARRLAAELARRPAAAVVATKRLLLRARTASLPELLEEECLTYDELELDDERNAARAARSGAVSRGG